MGKFHHLGISGVTRVRFWSEFDLGKIGSRIPSATSILISPSHRMGADMSHLWLLAS